ncbi:MAG: uvrC [Clostridiales bacterium]|jgi:excinuclease ABC subunit C|nr:uvrC [Clostridiales bacterium]
MFDIQEELKKLPDKPGVYIMKNVHDDIIYVGKAIVLKNRVRQYFQSNRNLSLKIQHMVENIDHFEYIITDSELEALVLECNLIKLHHPKYNTMLKDDKQYPYVKLTINEEYPRVFLTRTMKKDKAKYFGPYTSVGAVKDCLDFIKKVWKIRDCDRRLPRDIGKQRVCLNYHIGQCSGPCNALISKEEYNKVIDDVADFLNGKTQKVTKMLEEKMASSAENMEFEKAAEYRDLINSVKIMSQKQKMSNSGLKEQDVLAMARVDDDAVVQAFFIREGRLLGHDQFFLNGVEGLSKEEIMTDFVKQFYAGTPYIPKEILLEYAIVESEEAIIKEWLSERKGHKVEIKVPQKGEKSEMITLASKNASNAFVQIDEKKKRELKATAGAADELRDLLNMEYLNRIESYDISNTSGYESVGSMVVYEGGKPKKNDYRRFRIRDVIGPNDYKSMEEVLTRRFSHAIREKEELREKNLDEKFGSFTTLPDLILMDGGKGQVNVALRVLEGMKLNIKVCGMVKDDNHNTRGLYYDNEEVPIQKNSFVFKLIARIQDETHRFAIEYHKTLRGKVQLHSILDDINGIGPAKRKALMGYFKSIEAIAQAEEIDLAQVDGITPKLASEIYTFFRNRKGGN